ncbi:glycosyltransferase family A protein [Oceanidesulfovibrio marinus]|uniref:Glycosyltransferase family 2 protein n=1 Tax=Oceanidesulfovibrio marinus TaxID=370038 RepID=A0ABX6NGR7_9BACT|nr:glycosyltransferase family A protein [Oceanidesulfovibrio marinus]QJT09799.1 glycosyltransferase family 2 protein [Oceanidesulfovibrio marinus]
MFILTEFECANTRPNTIWTVLTHRDDSTMNTTQSPAIVVLGYNRPESLRRILGGLNASHYPHDVTLVISIDKSDSLNVLKVAEEFQWKGGPKRILTAEESLGLRRHVLRSGDLTEEYGSIILLEDDIYPSPHFYNYAASALDYYQDDDRIAGISLYSPQYNETSFMGFRPMQDDVDAYFLALPSSWGQAWTWEQWRRFKAWYDANADKDIAPIVPPNVRLWPESSWKKYFIAYMCDSNLFFVYPYLSFSTNFSDIGVNHKTNSTRFQVPIHMFPKEYVFKPMDESLCVYDEYCELLPDRFVRLAPHLGDSDLVVDLYGVKDLNQFQATHILTSRPMPALASWSKDLKPHELNVVCDIKGNGLNYGLLCDCDKTPLNINAESVCYYYNVSRRVLRWCRID